MGRIREEWVAVLSSPESQERESGAIQIYGLGRSLVEQATRGWRENAEFAALVGKDLDVTVGLAVRPRNFARIREINGRPRLAEVPADQDASEFELHFGARVALDVLTPRNPQGSGPIAKFLSKFGEDIQQVELRCNNVDRAAAILREKFNLTSVYPEARPGADGTRVNFFLVNAADGNKILVELYEPGAIRLG